MGQTLTHGVYLPDEGERNCYSGLAANWQLLDNSVGTIAEHTSQIAGKAPLVHTHTKSDITDFPAYGTTAGTICEGNDSRLSDARTPVAHTHTKSDVTDLFNSANTWTEEQTFSQTIQGNAATASEFVSNQSVTLTGTIEGTASSKAGWTIATDFREGRGARTTTDFYAKLASGSVSGGWNVHVDTFICNASERFETALVQICFVLNQQGIVDATNSVQLRIRSINGLPQTRFVLVYKNDTNRVLFELYAYNPSTNQGMIAQLLNKFIRNGNKQSINIQMHSNVVVNALPDGYAVVNAKTALTANDFIPSSNNVYELGSSSYKWKSLNGINPGALSLPIASNVDPIDFSQWNVSGGFGNAYTPVSNGWLHINIKDTATNSIFVFATNKYSASIYGNGSQGLDGRLALMMPVLSGVTYAIIITAGSVSEIYTAKFIPCQGNV